jgi:hypothetical protein
MRNESADAHCGCLYCGLTDAQKRKFHKDAKKKKQVLMMRYDDARNATIGAKAEAIFAAIFDLGIDDGIYPEGDYEDFMLHGHVIEVKGTPRESPNPVPYLRRDGINNRVYVFIRVALDNDHAFFQGFAVDKGDWYHGETGYLPSRFGTWDEFNRTVSEWKADAVPFPF